MRTCTVSERRKTEDRDDVAKYIVTTGCRKRENRHAWAELTKVGQLPVMRAEKCAVIRHARGIRSTN